MDRINASKRKRESPDEDEMSERKEAAETAKSVVNKVFSQHGKECHLSLLQVR